MSNSSEDISEGATYVYKKIVKRVEQLMNNHSTTFSTELNRIGKYLLGNKFKGVFSADNIPTLQNEQYCIVNLDRSYESGSHWVSLARKNNKTYFFDSFGRNDKQILPLLSKSGNGKILNTDSDPDQRISEYNCGQKSIGFLVFFELYGEEKALEI